MGHAANSHSPGSGKKILAVYRGGKSFKETKTYKMEHLEHHKVSVIGVFEQYKTTSLLLILSSVQDYILWSVQQLEVAKE